MRLKIKNSRIYFAANLLADFLRNRSRPIDSDPVPIDDKNGQFSRSRGNAAPYRSPRMSDRVITRRRSARASCNQPVGALFLAQLSIKLSELTLTVQTTKLSSRKLRRR